MRLCGKEFRIIARGDDSLELIVEVDIADLPEFIPISDLVTNVSQTGNFDSLVRVLKLCLEVQSEAETRFDGRK